MSMDYAEYVQPELLVLVPILYLIGEAVKRSELLDTKYLPLLLGLLGINFALLYEFANHGLSEGSLWTGLIQGVLVAGCAVYANQIYKQSKKPSDKATADKPVAETVETVSETKPTEPKE